MNTAVMKQDAEFKMTSLIPEDLHHVVTRLPGDLRKLMREKPIFLAGGAIRALVGQEEINDYDLFGYDKVYLEEVARAFAGTRAGRIFKTDNAITVACSPRKPVQFITRWTYSDPVKIAESFDFSIAQAVVWYECSTVTDAGEWKSCISGNFYADLAAKRLRYLNPVRNEDAGGSMLRVMKFLRRGYSISPASIGKVITRLITGVKEDNPAWSSGDEYARAAILTSLLREVDPLTIVDGLELVEIHEFDEMESKEEDGLQGLPNG